MRRFFLTLLVVVLVMGIVYLSAPFFAFRALKAAARVEDVAAITEVVDFPAVRASLTEPVQHAPVRAEAPSIWQDPLGAMKHVFQPLAPPEPRVDRYLTPAGLYDLTRGYDPGEGPPAAPPAEHWWDR
ncbi:MAG: hypothetical protein JWP23_1503, partial [Phenylobacterium sp.]|nr:hypothetical protein [Phenylobacterium sp.]